MSDSVDLAGDYVILTSLEDDYPADKQPVLITEEMLPSRVARLLNEDACPHHGSTEDVWLYVWDAYYPDA